MWIYTERGMLSCVATVVGNERKIAVRARVKEHLTDNLALANLNKVTVIKSEPGRDYAWRCFLSDGQFVNLLTCVGLAVDYTNFKNTLHFNAKHSKNKKKREYFVAACDVYGQTLRLRD